MAIEFKYTITTMLRWLHGRRCSICLAFVFKICEMQLSLVQINLIKLVAALVFVQIMLKMFIKNYVIFLSSYCTASMLDRL